MMLTIVEAVLWLIRFFFGACVFSFLNVMIDRIPRGESVAGGRSHCTGCGRILTPLELIPCISFLCLRGRCRGCGAQIPVRDFVVELFGGAAFMLCSVRYGCGSLGVISLNGAVIFLYLGILVVVSLIDWDTQIIYDRFHIFIVILAVAHLWLFPQHGILDRLLGMVVISVPMLVLSLVIPGAFGGGDFARQHAGRCPRRRACRAAARACVFEKAVRSAAEREYQYLPRVRAGGHSSVFLSHRYRAEF